MSYKNSPDKISPDKLGILRAFQTEDHAGQFEIITFLLDNMTDDEVMAAKRQVDSYITGRSLASAISGIFESIARRRA